MATSDNDNPVSLIPVVVIIPSGALAVYCFNMPVVILNVISLLMRKDNSREEGLPLMR